MPAASLQSPAEGFPPRKRFTVRDVQRMLDAGLLAGERVELIDGDLIDKMGQNPPHAYAIRLVFGWLAKILEPGRIVVQSPIEAGPLDRNWSLPEPDLAVLKESKDEYRERHPRGDELLLLVEVADSSAKYDATTKRDIYARAGVREYWVLDVSGRQVTIHRAPVKGKFEEIQVFSAEETVSPEFQPGSGVLVSTLLP